MLERSGNKKLHSNKRGASSSLTRLLVAYPTFVPPRFQLQLFLLCHIFFLLLLLYSHNNWNGKMGTKKNCPWKIAINCVREPTNGTADNDDDDETAAAAALLINSPIFFYYFFRFIHVVCNPLAQRVIQNKKINKFGHKNVVRPHRLGGQRVRTRDEHGTLIKMCVLSRRAAANCNRATQ